MSSKGMRKLMGSWSPLMRSETSKTVVMSITDLRYTGLLYTWLIILSGVNWIGLWSISGGSRRGGQLWPTSHADFLDLVDNAWRLQVEGIAVFRLCEKLKALKNPLKKLNRLQFSHISAKAEVAEEELLQAQQLLHDNPRDENLQTRVADLRKKAIRLAEADLSFCSQLAKVKYLKNCDKGTKFFHDLIKSNKVRNQIVSLIVEDGVATTSPQQVSTLFVEYYKNLLGTRKECLRLDKESLAEDGICTEEMEEIKSITRFRMGEFPFRYLGIPVAASRLTIEQFKPLISKKIDYISAWTGASLSYAGRSELIKSVLRGVECFWLSILPIPLGSKKDSLWVKWMNHIYTKDASFWEYIPAKQDSQLVRHLAGIRDKIVAVEGSYQAALDRLHQWAALGTFNVKAGYEFFRNKGTKPCWTKIAWHRSLMPKHSFILWLRLKKRLLTRDKALTTIKAAAKWIIKEARGTGVQAIAKKTGLACTVYCIWKHRKARMFEGKISHPYSIIRDIKIQVYRSLHGSFPNLKDLWGCSEKLLRLIILILLLLRLADVLVLPLFKMGSRGGVCYGFKLLLLLRVTSLILLLLGMGILCCWAHGFLWNYGCGYWGL
ncbi:hypothetical protein Acr_15g0007140 [Actinidia rufa]|uniref:Reverse transcriptase zinc-binding domain-containing protein n=1 Tax=Actinidia rufa TaxID=165716 RepID=A0A7J0FTS2_9ERIC|nr:hypothetical protein Acr_15g0007140 [Actinidia rufa]